jgi:hypothetical protein
MSEEEPARAELTQPAFSLAAKRLMALDIARHALSMELDAIRQLLSATTGPRRKTEELKKAESRLTRDQRCKAEQAARLIGGEVGAALDPVLADLRSVPTVGHAVTWYPHLEELAILAMDRMGWAAAEGLGSRFLDLSDNHFPTAEVAFLLYRWSRSSPDEALRTALVTALVRAFENFFGACLRTWHLPRTATTFTDEEAARVLGEAATAADVLLNKGAPHWQIWLADQVNMDVHLVDPHGWLVARELFARRNAIEHAGSRADWRYLSRLPERSEPPPRGTVLLCDRAYVNDAADAVEGVADVIEVAIATRIGSATDQLAELATEPVFRALRRRRYEAVKWMAEQALHGLPDNHRHHEVRVNLWMSRQELGQAASVREEIAGWSPPPDERYQIARAALLDDERAALAALHEGLAARTLDVKWIADWPLVQRFASRSPRFEKELRLGLTRLSHHKSLPPDRRGRRGGRRRR